MTFDRQTAIYFCKAIESLYAGDIAPNITHTGTDTQVLVEKITDGRYAIIFPGSASRRDWLTNVEVLKTDWFEARVHRGFRAAYLSISRGLEAMLPPEASVVIAGHSLGGAMATLAADDLADSFRITNVFTFGAPRCGNARFAGEYSRRLGDRTARVVNAGDPVPHVPWIFGTYRHVDTLHYLDRAGGLRRGGALAVAMAEWSNVITTFEPKYSALTLAAEHHIAAYRRKLEALA